MIPRRQQRSGRRGFTLAELLVVIGIISVLAGLIAGAVIKILALQPLKNTETLLRKLHDGVQQQWSEASKQFRDRPSSDIPQSVVTLAGGDTARAQVVWLKLQLKREFPMSYAEIQRPGGGLIPDADLPPIYSYVQALGGPNGRQAANDPTTESAACLLIALQNHPHKGMKFNVEEALGASAIRDTDNDGVPEIVDGWGTPIAFFRWGTGNADLNALARNALGNFDRDTEDPFHKLMDQNWNNSGNPNVTSFEKLCHRITDGNGNRQSFYTIPVLVSAGPDSGGQDKKFGLARDPSTGLFWPSMSRSTGADASDEADNLYSFKVR